MYYAKWENSYENLESVLKLTETNTLKTKKKKNNKKPQDIGAKIIKIYHKIMFKNTC